MVPSSNLSSAAQTRTLQLDRLPSSSNFHACNAGSSICILRHGPHACRHESRSNRVNRVGLTLVAAMKLHELLAKQLRGNYRLTFGIMCGAYYPKKG